MSDPGYYIGDFAALNGKLPSQSNRKPEVYAEPFLFEWHQNRVQEALQLLHDTEAAHRPQLEQIICELQQSEKFWQLNTRFSDALQAAGSEDQRFRVMLTMFARMYTAGSLQRTRVFENVAVMGD